MDGLEVAIEQHELVGQPPLHRTGRAVVEAHRDPAARALGHPFAHGHSVGTGAVLSLHVIEAVNRIVRQVEGLYEAQHRERRIRQVSGESRVRPAVAAERRRQRRVRHTALVDLASRVVREPVRARVRTEEVVEGAVLQEENDDVVDGGAVAAPVAARLAADARARGEEDRQRRRAREPAHSQAEAAAALSFFFLPFAVAPPSAFGVFSFFSSPSLRSLPPSTRSTSSRMTIGALSPGRRPVLMMRV